jgi:hypothetical protein
MRGWQSMGMPRLCAQRFFLNPSTRSYSMLRKNVFGRLFSTLSFSENAAMNARTALLSIAILFVAGWNSTAQAVLQAYWKFDETAGSIAANSSGSVTNYNGTLTNFVTDNTQWQTGRFGNALRYLDGNDVVLLNANNVNINANWTISAWFLAPISDVSTPLHHTLTRGSVVDHQVILNNTAAHPLGTYDNGGSGFVGTSPVFNANTLAVGFHQLVAVGTGTTTTFFVDGVNVGVSNFKSTSDVFALGNYQFGGQTFADKLDDMGVFDQALTTAEAKSIFSLAMVAELNYDLGKANQLIQAFETSAPSVQIGDQTWFLIANGSLTGAEGEVQGPNSAYLYSLNLGDGNGFAVLIPAPEPSSLLLAAMGSVVFWNRRRRTTTK